MSSSKWGKYIDLLSGGLTADFPMSTAQSQFAIQNARHLVDQAAQTRVNWVAWGAYSMWYNNGSWQDYIDNTTGNATEWGLAFTPQSVWCRLQTFYFPVSLTGSDNYYSAYSRPIHLVIGVAGYESASEMTAHVYFRAVLQNAVMPFSADLDNNNCLAYIEGDSTTTSSTWVIDGVTTSLYPENIMGRVYNKGFVVEEYNGNTYPSRLAMMRLTIYGKGVYSVYGYGHLTGVYVREYQA